MSKAKQTERHLADIRSAARQWHEDRESIIALLTGCLALADKDDFAQIQLLGMASDISADLGNYQRILKAAEVIERGRNE